jgi:hypothetical protein
MSGLDGDPGKAEAHPGIDGKNGLFEFIVEHPQGTI